MNINFPLWAAYLKTYSVQALLFLAAINAALGTMSATDLAHIPGWFIGLCNIAGLIVTLYLRSVPQPVVALEIEVARRG